MPADQVAGAIGIATDITERKRMEKALRESEAFYHSLVESLPQNIFRKDRQGRFTFANQRFAPSWANLWKRLSARPTITFFRLPWPTSTRKTTAES